MKAIVEVQIIPIGAGVSVRKEVMRAHELLEESGLNITLHANGSNIEGELGEVLETIQRAIETLHSEGVVRLSSHIPHTKRVLCLSFALSTNLSKSLP